MCWRSLAILLVLSLPAIAQTNVGVELDEVTDNRVKAGPFQGSLELRVKITGNGLEKATASRILIKEAKDDRGNDLAKSYKPADFYPREYNMGNLSFGLAQPAREATRVKLKGTVELYVPGRDPAATVKVDKALSKLDVPLSSKALKAAKVEITPLSRAAFVKQLDKQKIDEAKIAAIREEGKKRGVSQEEIDMAIEFAQALQTTADDVPGNAIILTGSTESFDRVYRIEILGDDGKPIDTPQRSSSSFGEDSIMTIIPASDPPKNATMQLYLLTQKSRVSAPFELTVELP
jgi:hypothetical protein